MHLLNKRQRLIKKGLNYDADWNYLEHWEKLLSQSHKLILLTTMINSDSEQQYNSMLSFLLQGI